MTNREWIAALDEFEKTVAIVNFVREIPEKLQDDKETVKKHTFYQQYKNRNARK